MIQVWIHTPVHLHLFTYHHSIPYSRDLKILGLPFKNDCILLRASIAVPRNENYKQFFCTLSGLSQHLLVLLGWGHSNWGNKQQFWNQKQEIVMHYLKTHPILNYWCFGIIIFFFSFFIHKNMSNKFCYYFYLHIL